jgi:hypothetical protein
MSARPKHLDVSQLAMAPAKDSATALRYGDVFTWTAIDADTKLMVSYMVGGRDTDYARVFIDDVLWLFVVASRVAGRFV